MRRFLLEAGVSPNLSRAIRIGSLAVAPSRRTAKTALTSASDNKTVRLWDARSGRGAIDARGPFALGQLAVAHFSPDGKTLASASRDQTVRLWDARSGAALSTLEGHSSWVRSVAFSPDGKTLASASDDNTVRLWGARSGAALSTLEGHSDFGPAPVAFSPDGKSS